MLRLLLALWLGLAPVWQSAHAQSPAAASTTDRHHPFVEHAEKRYRQYLASQSEGNVSAYKEVRTKRAYETTMEQLKKLGKAPSELGPMVKSVASLQTDIAPLTFVRCDAKPRVARLLYTREGSGPKGSTLEFLAFMIHWEDGAWRIDWVGHATGSATRSDGGKRTADEMLLGDPRFALD
jgi:hypothetical protein